MYTVLLIESNTLQAAIYTKALTHGGFKVIHVTGAQTAINAADQHIPDIVVLELQLPQHSGIEFLHEFRSYPEWQRIPVMMLTNVPMSSLESIEQPLRRDLGVTCMLYKPRTSLELLVRRTREQLRIL